MGLRYLFGALVILGAFAAISVLTYYDSEEAYFTVDELTTDPRAVQLSDEGRSLQIRGEVDRRSLDRSADGLAFRFDLVGLDGRMPVIYRGLVPDTFDQAESVTVGGHMAPDGTFVADRLYVQCPSKYEAVPPEGALPDSRDA